MFKGFYTVASGMLAQQRRTDMLTNNMANANTPGFKADQSSMRAFPDMLLQRFGQTEVPVTDGLKLPNNTVVGHLNTGVYMQEAMPNFLQGDLQQTENKTDVALMDVNVPGKGNGGKGSLFFTVQNQNGEKRYTRNGNFTLDSQGFLTAGNGFYVLDDKGQRIHQANDQFTISESGDLTGKNGERAHLGIGYAENPNRMIKEADGLYRTETGTPLVDASTRPDVRFKTQQGFLERSNVDESRTMTDMLSAYRAFEANQKVLQAYDKSMDEAVNQVGKV
ncbi:MAG: flagellar hook-basal body protein [Bacillota bacterium]|nr:flagellar hook-basal body protein [Bacillota bacterium]MDP4171688.1 flagellar hook-basal body protein [Bacillota bacterium]